MVRYLHWNNGELFTNPIKFLTSSRELSLCDYSNAYILVSGNIAVKNAYDADLTAVQMYYFKTVHHLKIAEQKSMRILLMK